MNRVDAWVVACLLSDRPVNGELAEVDPEFRSIARRLNGLPFVERSLAWESFLDGRPDRDKINAVACAAEPDEPCPDKTEDDEPADDWGPIRIGSLPPAAPFPIDVFPGPMARFVREAEEAIGCPPDFIAVSALVVASGAIGRSVSLKLKDDYFVGAVLWAANVGPPSDGKTPGYKIASAPVRRIDEGLREDHDRAMMEWDVESSSPGPDGKKKQKLPPVPRPRRIDVDDITMEALPSIMADNPRGLIRLPDELTSIFLGMNQYKGGKGNDRPTMLKIWSGEPIKKDRVNHEANIPIRCAHPFLSIVGGIPPDKLCSMVDAAGHADGFLDRWLFAYPDMLPVPEWSIRGVSDEAISDWCELVGLLWARPMNVKEGRFIPHVAFFTPDGETTWIEHYNAHSAEMNSRDFPPSLRGPWGKLREYAGRLALVLACLHHAPDPTADPSSPPRVGPDLVKHAWRLVAYFKAHARRVYAAIGGKAENGNDDVKALLGWIIRNDNASFSTRDIDRNFDRFKDHEAELVDALSWMTARNLIRPVMVDATSKPGRRPSPQYEANPELWKSPRFRQFRQNNSTDPSYVGKVGNAVTLEDEK